MTLIKPLVLFLGSVCSPSNLVAIDCFALFVLFFSWHELKVIFS